MADAPWRCSQCGTVNEPVANACRTCGRWPSLFELEGSTIESEPEEQAPPELYDPEVVEPEYVEPEIEPEVFDVGEPLDVEVEDVDDDEDEPRSRSRSGSGSPPDHPDRRRALHRHQRAREQRVGAR